nr:RNA-directed DNA polymerase, eukaryota, reverse transcriptase zinc-binding domain protein [Tanacetum cinerariifolium]
MHRLLKWKANLLSIGERSTLITSVLGTLCNYYFSMFSMPSQINKRLEAIRSKFFLGSYSWIAWNTVLASKPKGGLGIVSLLALNLALIQKWRWRYVNKPDSLWVKLMAHIKGDRISIKIVECMVFGPRLRVPLTLCTTRTPLLFPPSRSKMDMYPDCTVPDIWNSGWIWTWSRSINGGATKAQLDDLSSLLDNSFITDKDDSWILSLENSIVFNVKDTQNLIDDSMLPDSSTPTR